MTTAPTPAADEYLGDHDDPFAIGQPVVVRDPGHELFGKTVRIVEHDRRRGLMLVDPGDRPLAVEVSAARVEPPDARDQRLPKAARALLDLADACGWLTRVNHGNASSGEPYLTLHIARDDPLRYFQVTWHTFATGTYRLFSLIDRGHDHYWRDTPSIRYIRAFITENPATRTPPSKES